MTNFLEDVLTNIDNQPGLSVFYNRVISDPKFRKLFMLHPNDLFLTFDEIPFPVLFWSSFVTHNGEAESPIISMISDLSYARYVKASKNFPFSIESFPDELKDVFIYAAFSIARKNESIKELIIGEFSLEKAKKVLNGFDPLWENFTENEDIVMQHLIKKLGAKSNEWLKEIKSNPLQFIESMTDLVPKLYLAIHDSTSSHIGSLLEKTGFTKEDYKQIITDLYALNLIVRQDTTFRCENCTDEPQLLSSSSRIGPNMMRINCPRCGNQMISSAILWINENLLDSILSKDGLISIAVAKVLRDIGIKHESLVSDEKFEYAFICETPKGKILIECKNHRIPPSKRSVKGSVEQDLQQAKKHMEKQNLSSAVVIFNYDLQKYQDIIGAASKKYGIDVISFSEATDYLESLKT